MANWANMVRVLAGRIWDRICDTAPWRSIKSRIVNSNQISRLLFVLLYMWVQMYNRRLIQGCSFSSFSFTICIFVWVLSLWFSVLLFSEAQLICVVKLFFPVYQPLEMRSLTLSVYDAIGSSPLCGVRILAQHTAGQLMDVLCDHGLFNGESSHAGTCGTLSSNMTGLRSLMLAASSSTKKKTVPVLENSDNHDTKHLRSLNEGDKLAITYDYGSTQVFYLEVV